MDRHLDGGDDLGLLQVREAGVGALADVKREERQIARPAGRRGERGRRARRRARRQRINEAHLVVHGLAEVLDCDVELAFPVAADGRAVGARRLGFLDLQVAQLLIGALLQSAWDRGCGFGLVIGGIGIEIRVACGLDDLGLVRRLAGEVVCHVFRDFQTHPEDPGCAGCQHIVGERAAVRRDVGAGAGAADEERRCCADGDGLVDFDVAIVDGAAVVANLHRVLALEVTHLVGADRLPSDL